MLSADIVLYCIVFVFFCLVCFSRTHVDYLSNEALSHIIIVYCIISKPFLLLGMGDGARRRLQLFANGFESKMNNMNNPNNVVGSAGGGGTGLQEASGAAAERRGLLDDDDYGNEDMIEFETRKKSD